MNKNQNIYGIVAAILMVLSFVSTTWADTPIKYFCFGNDMDGNLLFHQAITKPAGEDCFGQWYNDGVYDAYSFAQKWLDNHNRTKIILTSNIEFAGQDQYGDCAELELNAFKGKYLTLGERDTIRSQAGTRDTIKGLCFKSDQSGDQYIGFVYYAGRLANLTNVSFDNVYFDLESGRDVGIILARNGNEMVSQMSDITDISVKNSVFKADVSLGSAVGAVASYVPHVGNMKNIVVDNVTVKAYSTGGVIGIVASNGSLALNASDIRVSNLTADLSQNSYNYVGGVFGELGGGSGAFVLENIYVNGALNGSIAGGLAGRMKNDNMVTIKKTKVNANILSERGNYSVGGLVGSLSTSASVKLYIQHNSISGKIRATRDDVTPSEYCGYLMAGAPKNTEYHVNDNYYYGTDGSLAYTGFGSEWDNVCGWENFNIANVDPSNCSALANSVIERNFSNEMTGSNANGNLRFNDSYSIQGTGDNSNKTYLNGVIPVAQMTSPKFAAVLNRDEANWTVLGSNSLPTLIDANTKPV